MAIEPQYVGAAAAAATRYIDPAHYIGMIILIFGLAIAWHELGHWIAIRYFARKKLEAIFKLWPLGIYAKGEHDRVDQNRIYLAGILFGLVPIVGISIFTPAYWVVLTGYVPGCIDDVIGLIKNSSNRVNPEKDRAHMRPKGPYKPLFRRG